MLLTGCGLPLAGGVQEPRDAPAAQQRRGDIQVLPPGPRDDASPAQVVRAFFGAQSNPDESHAIARSFLDRERRGSWRDGPQVTVFDGALTIEALGRKDTVVVTGRRVGRIDVDGSYQREAGTLSVTVRLRQEASGRWVITEVPDGLLLSAADRDRSFLARNVYFLAPPGPGEASAHLVPDPVFVGVTADPADALVRRLLAGPSRPLGDSVQSAVPKGTGLIRPVRTDAAGIVTVDLSGPLADLPRRQREQLSAQLVWTLRGVGADFSKLRLLGDGQPVPVSAGGDNGLQDRSDWGSFDPDGLSPRAPALYVAGRRLRSLDGALANSPVSDDEGTQLVDIAAMAPGDGTLAVLTRVGREWQLRTGPEGGPFGQPRWRGPSLSSPSWGSGERGVWFLAAGRVLLAPANGRPVEVQVDDVERLGPVVGLRVSRDGARIALIAGAGRQRQLLVGRVRVAGTRVQVVGLRAVAPGVEDVSDVSWDSATTLVVLGRVSGPAAALPIRVAVDGSSVAPLIRVGLETTEPRSLAAAPGRPLVVAAAVRRQPVLFRDNGRLYVQEAAGAEPFYPG